MTETPYLTAAANDAAETLTEDTFYLAATIWAEARGEGELGMRLVAHVIKNRAARNRVRAWGSGIRGVCLHPWQFSAWNRNDPNRAKLNREYLDGPKNKGADRRAWLQAQQIAKDVLATRQDPTGGATFYHTLDVSPAWSKTGEVTPIKTVGHHRFYK